MVTETISLEKAFDPVFCQQTNQSTCANPDDIWVTQECYNNHKHKWFSILYRLNILSTEILLCKKSSLNWTFLKKVFVLEIICISIFK